MAAMKFTIYILVEKLDRLSLVKRRQLTIIRQIAWKHLEKSSRTEWPASATQTHWLKHFYQTIAPAGIDWQYVVITRKIE